MEKCACCANCGCIEVNLFAYESMIVLSSQVALFTVRCPHCAALVPTVQPIPRALHEEVLCAAREVGAGMGRDNGPKR